MPAEGKLAEVRELEELLAGATGAIGLNFLGLTVAQAQELRRALQASGARYRVMKNTLARIAAANVGKESFAQILEGPTGVVLFQGDPVAPVRALTGHLRTARLNIPINGAVVNGRFLTAAEVDLVATLPPREQLQAQVLGLLQAPAQGLLTVLSGRLRGLVTVLERRREQLEHSEGGAK